MAKGGLGFLMHLIEDGSSNSSRLSYIPAPNNDSGTDLGSEPLKGNALAVGNIIWTFARYHSYFSCSGTCTVCSDSSGVYRPTAGRLE